MPQPPTTEPLHFVDSGDVRQWMETSGRLSSFVNSIGRTPIDAGYLEHELGVPLHLQFAIRRLARESTEATFDDLSSIPFFSLCKGLLLPLASMTAEKAGHLFGFEVEPPPRGPDRDALLTRFLERDLGLSLVQKLSCVLGDPFRGRPGTFRRESLITLLLSIQVVTRRALLDRLIVVGDIAVLFAEARPDRRGDPALTAAEVLETLRHLADRRVSRRLKFRILRSILVRCGRLEAYFLAKLLLRKAAFGHDYQGPAISRVLAHHFGADPDHVSHAMALTDPFRVVELLEEQGPEGLRTIRLQPLVAVRPALASGSVEQIDQYPVWVERKYDGIRFMLHKSTDRRGSVLVGAYTRNRRDWLDLVAGLEMSIKALPAHSAIVDGELYGMVVDVNGARPASVYELYAGLQGERHRPVNMKFAAFDLLYLNGADLTQRPLTERRQALTALVGPLASYPLPVPLAVAEGQLANSRDDINRLYSHFRSRGYEGLIAKDPNGAYLLSARDPTWLKKKPEITLDLALLGAVFAVTERRGAGMFGSYVIGARSPEGSFVDVGDIAGVDRLRDAQIQGEIMREGLITGRRIERHSPSGMRPGMDLRPHIVVTVRFEGIVRDTHTGVLRLRGPKVAAIRSDKSISEVDSTKDIEAIYLRQRMG